MPSGFQYSGEEFDRVFMTDYQILDNFYGNQLWGWGINGIGELGDGTTSSRTSPVSVSGGGNTWKNIAMSDDSSVGIKTDGTLWTWGTNTYGNLGDANIYPRSSPGTTAGGGTNWKQVNSYYNAVLAIKTDGTLWTWGRNYKAVLATGDQVNRNSPGTTLGGGTNWKQVSCGYGTAGGVKTDGTLWMWGYNLFGGLGNGNTNSQTSPVNTSGGGTDWKQVSCGYLYSAAIKTDGTLWTWGYNGSGQLGTDDKVSRSSPGTTIVGGTNWKQVSTSVSNLSGSTAAIKTDGTLWTWGSNFFGQLGDGTTSSRTLPVSVSGGGTNWKSVVTYGPRTAAIKTDGTLWMWGANYNTTYGIYYPINGTTSNYSSPLQITAYGTNNKWKIVSTSLSSTLAVVEM